VSIRGGQARRGILFRTRRPCTLLVINQIYQCNSCMQIAASVRARAIRLSIHETNTSSDTSDPNSSQSKFQQATVPCIHRHTRSVGVRHNTVFKAVKALWNLQWVSGRSVVTCRTFLVFMWSKSNHFEGRTDRPTDGRTHRYKRDALQNSTCPAGTVQGVIFRENSQKVDEHFSQFFVKNFTETKESRFGNFFSWKFAQNSLDDFAIFRENTQQLR